MKKIIYSAIALMAFVNVSNANTKENVQYLVSEESKTVQTELIAFDKSETVDLESAVGSSNVDSDFAGFVCWLFSMRCQPI